MWLITNKHLTSRSDISITKLTFAGYSIFTDLPLAGNNNDHTRWLIDGYVLPRYEETNYVNQIPASKLISSFYLKHGDKFFRHIKGNFIVIQVNSKGFGIFSDLFAIRKFFVYQNNEEFIISNDLKEISSRIKPDPSPVNMALYSLTYHFTSGRTLFNDIRHNQPGEYIEYNNTQINVKKYWEPDDLLKLTLKDVSIGSLSDKIRIFIRDTIPDEARTSLSLTGGSDTRNLLAAFLSLGLTPHLYT